MDEYEAIRKGKEGYKSEKFRIEVVREYFKGEIVQDIGVREIEGFRSNFKSLPTRFKDKEGNPKRRTGDDVNRHLGTLCSILEKAVRWDMIRENPARARNVERETPNPARNTFLRRWRG